MTADTVLAIDNGTQSVRALLFDLEGNLLAKSKIPIDPYYSMKAGYAEQDPHVYWNGVIQACKQLWLLPRVHRDRIAAVSLTTQRSTLLNVDEEGKPLRPAMVWLDQRRTEGLKPVGGFWGALFKLSGMSETVAYLQAEAEANWIRTHQPEIWKNTHRFLLLSGFLTYMLTGKFVDSVGSQVGYIPFDYKKQDWAADSDWKWDAVGVPRSILPDLVPVGSELGPITTEAAEATGIPVGLPLIAAAADKACEVIGTGCFEPHMGCLSYGTSATINVTHNRYKEIIPLIPPYPAAIPGAYSLELQVYRGYWMVKWFKEEFGMPEVERAAELGIEPEDLFDDLVRSVPAGSEGLLLQPYWSPGLRSPGPEARGAVIGFDDVHTRAHLYRAILEGLAYALREGAERTAQRTRVPVTELRVAGGGSQSDAAMQLTADIFGLPAARAHTYEASGLGAAIDAAVGVGLHPDFPAAIEAMTHRGEVFSPNPKAQRIYDRLYKKVYQQMYPRLKPLYERIRDIIG
jgi:sugar (pentulose or hexulose) kinase